MKNFLVNCCLLFISTLIFSQDGTFLHDITGKPYMLTKFTKLVEGSPFFKEVFMRGNVILSNGHEFKNQQLRLNLLDNQLHYLDNKQQEMVATASVREVILFDSLNNQFYFFIHSDFLKGENKSDYGWYERLSTGKAYLLKQFRKEMKEIPLYGSASTELSITTQQRYFILYEGKWNVVKKIKNIPELLEDKKSELLKFIRDQKIDNGNEANLVALIVFYNSLQ